MSSAELVYGSPLTLPGEFLSTPEPPAEDFLESLHKTPPIALPTRPLTYAQAAAAVPEALQSASHVYVRRGNKSHSPPLTQLYQGPYAVRRRGPKSFDLEVGGKIETITVDRLKPHVGKSAVTATTPAP